MQGPFSMGTGAESVFHLIRGDLRLKTVPIIYTSGDGSLSCRLTSFIPTGDIEEKGFSRGGAINYNPEELFEIDSLGGKERLLEIMKEEQITEDFPIRCGSEEEAIEILKKLLDNKTHTE